MVRKLLGVVVALLVFAPAAQACQPVFSTCSSQAFVNKPIPPGFTVDPNANAYLNGKNGLLTQVRAKNTWINTASFGVTVYYVPPWQPTVSVRVTRLNGNPGTSTLRSEWSAVPIPAGAVPANGTDSHMVVIQPDTDQMWEFWGGTGPENDGTLNWHAAWGGAYQPGRYSGSYSTALGDYVGTWSHGYEDRLGGPASSISVLAGLITASDLFSGSIDHAIAVGMPYLQSACFVWPAQRTDGNQTATGCDTGAPQSSIPMGQRFAIPSTVDLSKVPCHYPLTCMIDRALQKYGLFVRDSTGSSMSLYGEATTLEGKPDVWYGTNGFLSGQYANNLLADVDWADIQPINSQPEACCWAPKNG